MQRELDVLVRKLDRKTPVEWLPEMGLGKVAYDHLMACVKGASLTRHQRANALRALFRLRLHGSEEDVFDALRAHANHSEIRVRSEAITFAHRHDEASPSVRTLRSSLVHR